MLASSLRASQPIPGDGTTRSHRVGNVQLGTSAPAALTGQDVAFTLSIDKIAIVPEPGTALLAGFGLLGLGAISRRRAA